MPRAFRQFGLRTLLISLTLLGVVLGIWRGVVGPIDRQHAAAAKLTEKGAGIQWETRGPAWLRKWAGEYYVLEVVSVHVEGQKLTDEDLAPLQEFRSLERLYLAGNPIGDASLRYLSELKHLRRLSLRGTRITDDGLAYLAGLENLQGLEIKNTKVTGKGLGHLRDLPKLSELMHDIVFDDAKIKHLAPLPEPFVSELRCRGLTADGFRHLRELRDIWKLEIVAPQAEGWASTLRVEQPLSALTIREATLSDEELSGIVSSDVLSTLILDRVPVTDAALPALGASDELDYLILEKTEVTAQGFLRHLGPRAGRVIVTESLLFLDKFERFSRRFIWQGSTKPTDLPALRHCRIANHVGITGNRFEGANLTVLLELPALERAHLDYPLGESDARVLAKLPQLKSLQVDEPDGIPPSALKVLREAKSLELLDFLGAPLVIDP